MSLAPVPPCRRPEAGLGALSGALGAFAARRLRPRMRQGAEARTRLHVLTCMCACFAALMPNAMTSLLLVLELGRPRALADEFTDMVSAGLALPGMLRVVCARRGAARCWGESWRWRPAAWPALRNCCNAHIGCVPPLALQGLVVTLALASTASFMLYYAIAG